MFISGRRIGPIPAGGAFTDDQISPGRHALRFVRADFEDLLLERLEELRVLRMEIARRRRVPPYVIFHDTTLREIARTKPKTIDELRHVYGVGDRKAHDLGEAILAVVGRS